MGLRQEGYWEEHYKEELRNFDEDGDEGEVWFGLRLTRQIVGWLVRHLEVNKITDCSLLDIGCGNALLLCLIADKAISILRLLDDKNVNLVGVDYSESSISLARKVVQRRNLSDRIKLRQANILDSTSDAFDRKYKYLVDKGTLDAICLLVAESEDELLKTKTKYMETIYSLSEDGSIFVLASCNHTEEELMFLFDIKCCNRRSIRLMDKIETPKITFGGKQGSQVTCIVIEFSQEDV